MNLLERISHIRETSTEGIYEVYFIEDEFTLNEKIFLNEKELYALDNLYNGEFAIKVIN